MYSRGIEPEGVDGFTKNSYFIKISNSTEEMKKIKLEVRLLTQAAKELSKVADFEKKDDFSIDFARFIKNRYSQGMVVSIHRISKLYGKEIEYEDNSFIDI